MRRSTLMTCALLVVATSGCDWFKTQYAKVKARISGSGDTTTVATAPPGAPGGDTAVTATSPDTRRPTARPAAPQFPSGSVRPLRDEPYVSEDTGTVDPGMSEREVYSLWGAPAAVRRAGEFTYLYFKNGCEYSCGTMDLVILQNGQVVDAVVRWPGHGYSGESSSPPGTVPGPTRGGDTLRVRPDSPPPSAPHPPLVPASADA